MQHTVWMRYFSKKKRLNLTPTAECAYNEDEN